MMVFLYKFAAMRYLAIVFLLLACSDEPDFIDGRVSQYVNQFYSEASARGLNNLSKDVTVLVKPMDCGCDGVTYGTKIYIEQTFYDFNKSRAKANPQYDQYYNRVIESVVMHELGHAVLKKGHSSGLMAEKTPYHLYAWYDDKRKEFLDGLFE